MPEEEQAKPSATWRARVEQWRAYLPPALTTKAAFGVVLAVAGVVVMVAVGGWFLLRQSPPPVPIELPRAGTPEATVPGATTTAEASGTITVAAGGAVVRPGIYVVPAKARVADVITAAGGTVEDADLDQVNLAAKVSDADRVFVPRKGQPVPAVAGPGGGAAAGSPGGATAGTKANPTDLNTATMEQLEALPGVGPATAQAILSYRSDHGRFKSVEELLEVRGIGPAKFEALRPLVKVA